MWKKEKNNSGIDSWSNPYLSKLTSWRLYGRQWRELLMRSWDLPEGKDLGGEAFTPTAVEALTCNSM